MTGGDRRASLSRATGETSVEVTVDLDGSGSAAVRTGLPFFDHMLAQLARHGRMDLEVKVEGDLEVDAHHSVEDAGIVLGRAVGQAMGDRAGIRRFASLSLPLDEALVDVALDCSGRPYLRWDLALPHPALALGTPGFDPQLAEEFWRAAVVGAGLTLHVEARRGENTHHLLEAAFKGVARCLAEATRREGGEVPSTKGTLA
ncbi:MAG: imidazoleglycerol-phosphate dehydratase HisB [Acidimicrobiales bacterium]